MCDAIGVDPLAARVSDANLEKRPEGGGGGRRRGGVVGGRWKWWWWRGAFVGSGGEEEKEQVGAGKGRRGGRGFAAEAGDARGGDLSKGQGREWWIVGCGRVSGNGQEPAGDWW